MFRLPLLAAAVLLVACGDADSPSDDLPLEPAPLAEAAAEGDPAAELAPAAPPDCDALAAEVAADRYAGQLDPVAEHTVPFRTAAVGGDGCFLTFYREVTAPMLAPGEPFPYPYSFAVAGGDVFYEVDLSDADLPALTLAAVAFGDVDGNGEADVFLAHDEGRGVALLSESEAGLGRWVVDEPSGALFRTAREVRAHYERAMSPSARAARADGLADVTVRNATGMTLVFLYVAGCTESEGNDWAVMDEWATDYLGVEVLEADGAVELAFAPGCYVFNPVWEDDTSLQERVEVDGDTTVDLTLG